MGSKRELQRFDYKLYRKLAKVIHDKLCKSDGWCNYGQPVPEELRYDKSHPAEKRQELAGKRLDWYHHCQYAVDAENIAARVQFGKGSRVRAYPQKGGYMAGDTAVSDLPPPPPSVTVHK